MKSTMPRQSADLKTAAPLPLWEAADRLRRRNMPLAARHIARRLGVPGSTALLVAEAAGFCMERGR